MAMGPLLSWAVVITIIGAVYFVRQRKKLATAPTATKKHEPLSHEKKSGKPVFVTGGSGTDTAEPKKKKPKKSKKAPVAKEAVSTAAAAPAPSKDDDDVAEEVDLRDVARRLKAGGGYAGSQTSADGDIDEDVGGKSSSTDPTLDMLEPSSGGPGVLRIGPSAQLPRGQKKKPAGSSSSETGIHAAKNAKKKELKKAQREAERVEQQARFEQHRKAMRAEEAAQQKLRPAPAPAPIPESSAWTQVSSGKKSTPAAPPAAPVSDSSSALLDTFTPADSSDEKTLQLGDSWESIPPRVMVPEPQWNEVRSKKTRGKDRRAEDSDAPASAAEEPKPRAKAVAPAPEFVRTPAPPVAPPKATQPKKSGNGFSALDAGRTTSGSDWAEVDDNVENWAVHPESSDY